MIAYDTPEPVVDPLPYPQELETNKDLSVDPGDSLFDYCNGAWLRTQPIPEAAAVGGLYDVDRDNYLYLLRNAGRISGNGGAWVMDFICASASRLWRSCSHRARRS